jgi:hypothetical protein
MASLLPDFAAVVFTIIFSLLVSSAHGSSVAIISRAYTQPCHNSAFFDEATHFDFPNGLKIASLTISSWQLFHSMLTP